MAVLEPKLAILDETDSGLDIDALKLVAERRQRAARPRARDRRRHALPAAAQLHRARLRARLSAAASSSRAARSWRWSSRRRATAGSKPARSRSERSMMAQVMEKLQPWLAALERRPQSGAALAAGPARSRSGAVRRARLPDRRDEEWRFTNVAPIADAEFEPARRRDARASADTRRRRLRRRGDRARVRRTAASRRAVPRRWLAAGRARRARSRRRSREHAGHRRRAISAQLAEFGTNAFTALNTALSDDGAFVHIPRRRRGREADPLVFVTIPAAASADDVEHPRA